jgi:hypothetical protein
MPFFNRTHVGLIFNLGGDGHVPQARGFTVQNIELSFAGAVNPSRTDETHVERRTS